MIEVDSTRRIAKKGGYLLPCIGYSLADGFNISFIRPVSRLSRTTAVVSVELLARPNEEQQREDILEDAMHNVNWKAAWKVN